MLEATNEAHVFYYMSTPEHDRSFIGRYVYIYMDKGEMLLTREGIRMTGKSGIPTDIPWVAIKKIQVGHCSRQAKFFRLDRIQLHYQDGCGERTVFLTPTRSLRTPVWMTNKIVSEWVELLRDGWRKGRLECQPIAR